MSAKTVISVENLGKVYKVRHRAEVRQYVTFREVVANKASRLSRFWRKTADGGPTEDFWALNDISFNVPQGEVLGIIGRNGAGKSTLLKILSRISEPSRGRVRIKGRVASLLEVGTGFHPELTGRENIFLNGAILGMTRGEIRNRFDEIVDFAEIGQFLDTPVKRYSSGMYVRLAFAVAAHLEPEILVVDEVLAVGDAEFQKKCLGKMRDVSSRDGRTVLFVSHNLAAVRQLCSAAILIEHGVLTTQGESNAVADRYLETMVAPAGDRFRATGTGYVGMHLVDLSGAPILSLSPEQAVFVEFVIRVTEGSDVLCGFTIFSQMDVPIVLCASEYGRVALGRGMNIFRVRLPTELLRTGTYRIEGAVWDARRVYHQEDFLCHFQVIPSRSHEMHGRGSSAHLVLREPWVAIPADPSLLAGTVAGQLQ